MKNFLKKSLSILLAGSALFATACNKGGSTSNEEPNTLPPYDSTEYTQFVLADNKQTDYSIVVADDASGFETFGAEELQKLFKEATGATLPVVAESSVSFSETAKVISIGDNAFQQASGVVAAYDVYKSSGTRVVNKGSSVILLGGTDEGSLYAVYDFLDILFDYEYFDVDAYRLNKKNKVMLPVMDQTNIPDFDTRIFGDFSHEFGKYHTSWRRRFQFSLDGETVKGASGHSAATIIPLDLYYKTPEQREANKDWFYAPETGYWQLCYTSEGMTAEYIARLKQFLTEQPNATTMYLTDNDYPTWCKCQRCEETIARYSQPGTKITTVTYLLFLNKVVPAIEEWVEQEFPGRKIKFIGYAYQGAKMPPAYKDVNGVYHPNSPDLVVPESVEIQYASVEADRNVPFRESAQESDFLKKWATLAKGLFIYEYPQDAFHSLLPYDGLHAEVDNIRFAKELGHKGYKFQGNYNTQSSGFYNLRIYVISKLMWDTTLDPVKLVEDYMKYCYGDASDVMMELYEAMRDKLAYLREETGFGDNCLTNNLSLKNFPRNNMLQFETLIQKAYEKIDDLQYVDAVEYEKVFRRIKIEQMWIDYVNLSLHSSLMEHGEKMQKIDDFEYYALKYGIRCWNQTESIAISIESWRK